MSKKTSVALDRRRTTLRNRQQSAERATAERASLDAALETNAAVQAEYASRLRAARAEVAGMKKAIKKTTKKQQKWVGRRRDARRSEARAHQRVAPAQAKYERAVLADLVQREMSRDLATHATTATVVPAAPPPAAPPASLDQQGALDPLIESRGAKRASRSTRVGQSSPTESRTRGTRAGSARSGAQTAN